MAEIAAPLGLEVLEAAPAGGVLRVTIDRPGGVSVEDCATLSRALAALPAFADVALEVSSPGLDRKIRIPRDLALGARLRIERTVKVDGRRRYVGVVSALDGESLTVEVEGAGSFVVPFREIAVARLDPAR